MKATRLLAFVLALALAVEPAALAAGPQRSLISRTILPGASLAATAISAPHLAAAAAGSPPLAGTGSTESPASASASASPPLETASAQVGQRFERSVSESPRTDVVGTSPALAYVSPLGRRPERLKKTGVALALGATGLGVAAFGVEGALGVPLAWAGAFGSQWLYTALTSARSYCGGPSRADLEQQLSGILTRVGWTRPAPKIVLSNLLGKNNAFADLRRGEQVIGFGEGWEKRSPRALTGTLAHEVGHHYFEDTSSAFSHRGEHANFGLMYAFWLGSIFHGDFLAVLAIALAAAGWLTWLAGSRAAEQRADLFAAYAVGNESVRAIFDRAGARRWFLGLPDFLKTHPSRSARLAYLKP